MSIRIKEIVLRYEDDGQDSGITKEELRERYAPLRMDVHHHCAPPKIMGGKNKPMVEPKRMRREAAQPISIDLDEIESVPAK